MPGRRSSRLAALTVLTALVLPAHLWLASQVWLPRLGEGAADAAPRRIEVAFTRTLAQAPPPLRTLTAPPRLRRAATAAAAPAAAAAAAPDLPAVEPLLEAPPAIEAPPPAAVTPDDATPPFDWPPSTRLSYTLAGHWRGPIVGTARVEWLRAGGRYQVHLDVSAGLVAGRRSSSEGEITAAGLEPRRYDEVTRLPLREDRRLTIHMDADRVRLPGGSESPRPPGLQDSVSQFVQLTWLSITRPHWLVPGAAVDMAVALPRRVETITYEVAGSERLDTAAGPVEAVHIRPRNPPRAGDLGVEFWVAPTLQYLPVRVLIHQDAQSWVDLLIERLPEQSAEAGADRADIVVAPGERGEPR